MDLTRIDRSIEIKASPEAVWRALTNPVELGAWFQVRIDGDIAAGKDVWMTSTHPEHNGLRWQVWFVELARPKRLVWEWHPGAGEPGVVIDQAKEPKTRVTFTLEPTPGGTRVNVSETGFERLPLPRREKKFKDNTEGWTEVLVWIQKHVEKTH
jgi:uncharacterized protein YndB with AHSA1/START domain